MLDTKRLILYILLGIIVFSLWETWQRDYPSVPSITQTSESTTTTTTANTTNKVKSTAAFSTSSANLSNDLTKNSISNNQILKKIPEDRLVKIHTNVLDVAIDTLGGNVVQARLLKYPKVINKPESIQLLNDDPTQLYLAESGLISSLGPDYIDKQARYSVSHREYITNHNQKELQVRLVWKSKDIDVIKTFNFSSDSYAIKVFYEVNNHSQKQFDGKFFAQLKRNEYKESKGMFSASTYDGASISSPEKKYEKITYSDLAEKGLDRQIKGGWVAFQQHYFLGAWVPQANDTLHYYGSSNSQDNTFTIGFENKNIVIPAGEKTRFETTLYVGPEINKDLVAVSPTLKLTIDYGWLWIISAALFWVMQYLYNIVGNWGWSIVLVTLFIKAIFFKLSESSYRSMARMKDLAPKIQSLKERYGSDKQKLSQATMEMYRKEKINPLGGCLPMLIQIPVFIGLYYMLVAAVQLRQAPFIFWIHDLSAKDPFYVLPILTGLSMFAQQRLGPQSPDPMQAKMMMILFPLFFAFISLSFPSGLVLYFFVNNCISILQQWYINKRMGHFKTSKSLSSPSSSLPHKKK